MPHLVLLRDSSKTRFICTCDVVEVYRASKEGWTVLRKIDLYRAHDLGVVDVEELVEQVYKEWGEPGDKILPRRGKDYELLSYFRRLKDWRDENYPEDEPTKSIAELQPSKPPKLPIRQRLSRRAKLGVMWIAGLFLWFVVGPMTIGWPASVLGFFGAVFGFLGNKRR